MMVSYATPGFRGANYHYHLGPFYFSHCDLSKPKHCGEILQNLEVLHKISAGDFVPSNLLLHQSLWGQQQRHQFGQFTLKIIINV